MFDNGNIGPAALQHHCEVLTELHQRDRHHPCVIAWSVANEPASWEPACRPYFETVVNTMRQLDATRPVMLVLHMDPNKNQIADLCDILGLNRYFGWYEAPGQLETAVILLQKDLETWHHRFGKPIVITEYGVDTIAGFHQQPPAMFSEEYQ